MVSSFIVTPKVSPSVFTKTEMVDGRPVAIPCVQVANQVFTISKGPIRVVRLEDEWYDDLIDPELVLDALKGNKEINADLFTFWQRLPEINPRYAYFTEWEHIAALPVKNHAHWWESQIKSRTRNLIRKAEKEGLEVRETSYDDAFVQGMTNIFNESPVRQGRRFWHYGKDFATVKKQFSRYISREYMVGAYFQGELIGFMMLGNARRYGLTGQIISSLHHRDKSVNNALMGKAVEICEREGLSHLVYFFWTNDSLAEFKRRCGFEKTSLPRYFVPLTQKGEFALRTGIHRGWKHFVPERLKEPLKNLRRRWLARGAE